MVTHDYCHCLNLVIKQAISKFPRDQVDLVEKICISFAKSPIKSAQLRQVMYDIKEEEKDFKLLTVKRYVPTRWTSFYDCVSQNTRA